MKKILYISFLGHDKDGDIYKPKNITSLEKYVMEMTGGKGVHFIMADGVSEILCYIIYYHLFFFV